MTFENKNNLPERLLQPYNPSATESVIYKIWEESGFFNPDKLPARHVTPWTTIMPPPNANGRLHAGHALDSTLNYANKITFASDTTYQFTSTTEHDIPSPGFIRV